MKIYILELNIRELWNDDEDKSLWNRLGSLAMAPRTAKDRAATLRRKLITNEINPFVDILLSMLILFMSPFIALSAFLHDKMMYNFLNKTYIYNVSWEVSKLSRFVAFQGTLADSNAG